MYMQCNNTNIIMRIPDTGQKAWGRDTLGKTNLTFFTVDPGVNDGIVA